MIDVYEVVRKLIGSITPVGETQTDGDRFQNLQKMGELVEKLLVDMDEVFNNNKNSHEDSRRKACQYVKDFFDSASIHE